MQYFLMRFKALPPLTHTAAAMLQLRFYSREWLENNSDEVLSRDGSLNKGYREEEKDPVTGTPINRSPTA